MQLSQQQVRNILDNAPAGSDKVEILDGLVSRGYELEGVNMEQAKTRVAPVESEASDSFLEKAGDGLDAVFGGGKIGDAIGTSYVKHLTPQGRELTRQLEAGEISQETYDATLKGPSAKQIAGDTARVASNFVPIGRAAGLATKGLQSVGINRGVNTAGNIAAGTAAGAAIDTTTDIAAGDDISLGLETVIGAGLPASSPFVGALRRALGKGSAVATSEIGGALTGTSAETLEQAFIAAKAGGKQLDEYTEALRGEVTPEGLVENLRTSISEISSSRQNLFRDTLSELQDETVSTEIAKNSFVKNLADARVRINPNLTLNFNDSKLKLVTNAQTKIETAWQELSKLPENVSLIELDTTRQAIKGLTLAGDDPSANLANKLVEDAARSTRSAGEQVSGYKEMLDQFAESSEFLDELTRGLSSGERATIDQTYRRMATALKTNNEQRMALVRELDQMTDGSILSGVAGQQLSEAMPRGIFRQISAGIAGGALLTGGVSAGLLPALVLASPRVTGEFVRALGIGSRKADIAIEAIEETRNVLLKAGIIGGSALNPTED